MLVFCSRDLSIFEWSLRMEEQQLTEHSDCNIADYFYPVVDVARILNVTWYLSASF